MLMVASLSHRDHGIPGRVASRVAKRRERDVKSASLFVRSLDEVHGHAVDAAATRVARPGAVGVDP
jgi:hypothetical protein